MKIHLIDVRSPEEYKEGFRENAINLPIDEILKKSEYCLSILKNIEKDDEIKVYCFSGGRAEVAKEMLINMGYTNVVNIGGMK